MMKIIAFAFFVLFAQVSFNFPLSKTFSRFILSIFIYSVQTLRLICKRAEEYQTMDV